MFASRIERSMARSLPAGTYRPTHRTGHKCVVGLAKKTTHILGARQNVPTTPPRREHSDGVGIKHLAPNPRLIRAGRPMVRDLERGSAGLGPNRTVENLHPTCALQVGSEQDGNIVHLHPQHNGQMIRRDIGGHGSWSGLPVETTSRLIARSERTRRHVETTHKPRTAQPRKEDDRQ